MTAYRAKAEVEVTIHEAEDKQAAAAAVKRRIEARIGGPPPAGAPTTDRTYVEDVRATVRPEDVKEAS
jgi:hypothetical protein